MDRMMFAADCQIMQILRISMAAPLEGLVLSSNSHTKKRQGKMKTALSNGSLPGYNLCGKPEANIKGVRNVTECTDYEEYEDEELREMARSSDAWFRGTTEAIAIINELAQDRTVVDRAITRIASATNHKGHVRSMLKALQILNEEADNPDAFAQYLRDIRAPKT